MTIINKFSLENWLNQAQESNLDFAEFILAYNAQSLDTPKDKILQEMTAMIEVMRNSITSGLQGLKSPSSMVGGAAKQIFESTAPSLIGLPLRHALMRAIAVGEANASMGKIVAAPTAGASGILPAVLFSLQEQLQLSDKQLIDGLIVAGGIGLVIASRASLAGAIGGCQAECGSGAAMAAGMAVYLANGSNSQIANAVAITLKNILGLVCDPVAGLVEVPCIKRNAAATAQALVSAELALMGIQSVIPVDEVIDAMKQVGDALPCSLRETAQGGLAVTPTALKLTKEIFG